MAQTKTIGNITDCDVEVTLADQQKINEFARLNNKLEEVKALLSKKTKERQNLDDAIKSMILLEPDEPVPVLFGEAFLEFDYEAAEGELENRKKNITDEMSNHNAEITCIQKKMAELKVELYAKFGSSINLEQE
ncbi:unnamed protein product [Soboliphyme baturini]|uniref:Prefoldin subunit 4 n=1 Tax=Soboliphyme baturini TaxID=241478 RepID=A0A183J5Y0_9BILA|nr:unnamed protein product [Soboliphyme baturini]